MMVGSDPQVHSAMLRHISKVMLVGPGGVVDIYDGQ